MKIDGIPGEYFAQSFIYQNDYYVLCGCYHPNGGQASCAHPGRTVIWPVELENGIAYVPTEEEIRDAN